MIIDYRNENLLLNECYQVINKGRHEREKLVINMN